MPDDCIAVFLNRIYLMYYREKWYWKEDIWQLMWKAFLTAKKRYRRYAGICCFDEYAEKVILYTVDEWITENNRYRFGYRSLDEPFWDSDTPILSSYIAYEERHCPLELFDFISRLSVIKYIVCKEYILRRKDDVITDRLNITQDRLEEIKAELRRDFTEGYLI